MKSVSPKVVASSVSAAAVCVICWLASQAGVDVPAEVAAALVVIATFAAGWIKTDPKRV